MSSLIVDVESFTSYSSTCTWPQWSTLGVLPVEVVVDEPLALRGVLQVDPADDVRDAGEVVVDAGLESSSMGQQR